MTNWYEELSKVDCSEHVCEKNGLKFLPWMWAWHELKKRYPLSRKTVHEQEDGSLVWKDPIGCHVKTSVTIVWDDDGVLKEHTITERLPCMNFKNSSVNYDDVDSTLINKTVQRSLVKCIAGLGLGYYLYTQDELPEEVSRVNDLRDAVGELAKKKAAISEAARAKVAELCKKAERDANPNTEDSLITGNYKNIDDADILEDLKKRLMAIRK